jgi:hypothetical protein
MSEHEKQVAGTILNQLGGNRFIVMTGAKHLIYHMHEGNPCLSFQLPKRFAKDGIDAVRIALLPSDTYGVVFMKMARNGSSLTTVREFDDVYCDQLREIFTRTTGLETSLGTLRGVR